MIQGTFTPANGNTDIILVPATGIANPEAPTPAELNAGVWATPAVAFDGTTFPAATESDSVDDQSLLDAGNATSRGATQYEGTLNLFRPYDNQDTTSEFGITYNTLREGNVPLYIVTRVVQRDGTPAYNDFEPGDWISVYRVDSGGWTWVLDDEASIKYTVDFLTQGYARVYTQVATGDPVVVSLQGNEDAPAAVGDTAVLRAELGGKWANRTVRWDSSDPSVATVSQNGVVTAVGVGEADITATHAAATTPGTLAITIA